jgi:hypothetical protein
METWGAGSHYNTIDLSVFNIFNYQILPGIRAHEHITLGKGHPRHLKCGVNYLLHIYCVGDIAAAMTYKDADPSVIVMFTVCCGIGHQITTPYYCL